MIELTVENLHLDYGTNPVLKGVSMELRRGEVVSLLGPSGSGKTTLLRAVAGLEAAKQGRISINERVMFDSAAGTEVAAEFRLPFSVPSMDLCTDNAAMIAAAGYYRYLRGEFADLSLNAYPDLRLGQEIPLQREKEGSR